MAWLDADAAFDPDTLKTRLIGVQSALGDHDSGSHRHKMAQILFTRQGCVRLTLNDGALLCLLPPGRAAWIPAEVSHRAEMKNIVDYRSVWFQPQRYPQLPTQSAILNVVPLLRETIRTHQRQPLGYRLGSRTGAASCRPVPGGNSPRGPGADDARAAAG